MIDPDRYVVPAGRGEATLMEKRSRFLALAAPVATPEEALALVLGRRKEHHDAAHHCYAFRVGKDEKYSDDGEPSGTAGRPILGAIDASGVEGVSVVVTRYFGGVKLGPGGLVRAYGEAARDALIRAGAENRYHTRRVNVSFEFELTSPVRHVAQKFEARTLNSYYTDRVHMTLELRRSRVTQFVSALREATAGRAEATDVD